MKCTSLITLLILLSACASNQDRLSTLENKVIEIHDQVMVQTMNERPKLKQELRAKINDLDSTQVYDVLNQLNQADESMMVWMDQYQGANEISDYETNIKNLNHQMSKIKEVQLLTKEAIAAANSILK